MRRQKSSPYRKATLLGRDLQFYVDARRGDTASNVAFEYGLLGSDFLDDYVLEIDFPGRRVRFHETASFRFAGFEFGELPVFVAPKGWYNIGRPTDSVLGYDVLAQFVLRIDYAGRRLWLRRSGDRRVTLYGSDYQLSKRIGARLARSRSGYAVWYVEPAGVAAGFGLREGDVIVVPEGDAMISGDEILANVLHGGELTVARRREGVRIEIVLPEPAPGPEDALGNP